MNMQMKYGFLLIVLSISCIQSSPHDGAGWMLSTSHEQPKENFPDAHFNTQVHRLNSTRLQQAHNDHHIALSNYEHARAYTTLLTTHLPRPQLSAMTSCLPKKFKDNFEKRCLWDRYFTNDISKENYEIGFYNQLIASCGYQYTQEQLVQHQCAEMRRWAHYYYDGFYEFISSFPCYQDYILELDKELKNDKKLRKKVKKTEPRAHEIITNEAAHIRRMREREKRYKEQKLHEFNNQQRHYFAQENFREQRDRINELLFDWEEKNPERLEAYNQTIASNGQTVMRGHEVSSQAQTYLKNNGFDPQNYIMLDGNPLQQQLHHEIVDGIEAAAQLRDFSADFNRTMKHSAIDVFDGARRANEMGDCVGASKLIDLASTMVDYCSAVAEGFVEGVVHGVLDAVMGTYHMVRHPVDALQILGKIALKLAEIIRDYVPLYQPSDRAFTLQDMRTEIAENNERVANNWREADRQIAQWWNTTPTRDKLYGITKGIISTATNIIVGNKCLHLLEKVGALAKSEALAFCRKAIPEAMAAGSGLEMPTNLLNTISEAEQIGEVPASRLLSAVESSTKIIDHGKKLSLSNQKISMALRSLVEEGGSIERFERAIQKLENIPGVDKNIGIILTASKDEMGNLRGAFFELESGLQAIERGEEVININLDIIGLAGKQEFDVITKTKLIECKNWNWNEFLKNKDYLNERIAKLTNLLGRKNKIAKELGKEFCLHSRYQIPKTDECKKIFDYLTEHGIALLEG